MMCCYCALFRFCEMSALRRLSFSSDSSDNPSSHKRKNVKSKRPRLENHLSDPEEGEIPSDTGDEDDGLDEDLYGDEEDKQRLLKMSEKEREEELYRRSEYREALKVDFYFGLLINCADSKGC